MKFNTFLFLIFFGALVYAGIEYSTGITGVTEKNGDGCTCHNLTPDPTVWVRLEGPDTLLQGQTAQYTIKLSSGPAIEGGFNIASASGILDIDGAGVQKISDELTHTSPGVFTDSVLSWTFSFTAGNMNYTDTIYSVANSTNGNGNPSGDQWNFGTKFPIVVLDVIPVELTSFIAQRTNSGILLTWRTASELNNRGFELERQLSEEWMPIAFIEGNGTTTEAKEYSYVDNFPKEGTSAYRLKQIDLDGRFTYSDIIEVDFNNVISNFTLEQNYPNPFNPTTLIGYQLIFDSNVTLKVYDALGNEVTTLVDEFKTEGRYQISFDASGLASGIYYYTLTTASFTQSMKMLLLK